MGKLRYNHPADNLISLATLSLPTGSALAAFPLTNIRNLNPALPAKFADQSIRIVFDFGSATAVHLVALLHHNLDAALDVRWQANATDSWGGPTFSQALTIAATDTEGYRPNTYHDLSAAPPTFRYHSLVVVGANTLDVILGEIWIGGAVRTLVHNFSWPFTREDPRPGALQWATRAGVVWTYPSFGRQRKLESSILTTAANLATLSAWSQACGGTAQPTLIIPDAPDIPDAMLARWTKAFSYTEEMTDNDLLPVGWVELARSMPWP